MTPPDDLIDWQTALTLLVEDLGPPVPDPEYPGDYMFTWPTPFPDPCPHGFPPVPDGHLQVFVRADSHLQTEQGNYLKYCCEVVLPTVSGLVGLPRTRLHVDLWIVPRSTYVQEVILEQRFHIATGSLKFEGPEILDVFTGGQYYGWQNLDFDYEVELMLEAQNIGSPTDLSSAIYHAWLAQFIMESDEPLIPFFYLMGYKGYLSNWRHVVNEVGVGVDSWWTFMNTYKLGGPGYGDIMRYGVLQFNPWLNVISAPWSTDWDVLDEVYDTLLKSNPYLPGGIIPWIAAGWAFDTWQPTPGTDATTILFDLRTDVYWQDIPYHDRSDIAVGHGHQIDGPFEDYVLTPVDVVFSWKYQADNPEAWNGWLARNVVKIGLNPIWHSLWPYDVELPPWWDFDPGQWNYGYVEWDPTLAINQMKAYFDIYMPWSLLRQVGSIPLIPKHLWSQIPISTSGDINALKYDLVYGSGPFIFLSWLPGLQIILISHIPGQSYRGVTLDHGYWNLPPIMDTIYMIPGGKAQGVGWLETRSNQPIPNEPISYEVKLNKSMRFINTYPTDITVTYYFDYHVDVWNGIQWVEIPLIAMTFSSVVVPAGGAVTVWTPPTFKVATFGKIRIWSSYHWEWTYDSTTYSNTFWSPVPEVFLNVAADVNGDGTVNIGDANLILTNWQKRWYW
jgi:hypothetical protein